MFYDTEKAVLCTKIWKPVYWTAPIYKPIPLDGQFQSPSIEIGKTEFHTFRHGTEFLLSDIGISYYYVRR